MGEDHPAKRRPGKDAAGDQVAVPGGVAEATATGTRCTCKRRHEGCLGRKAPSAAARWSNTATASHRLPDRRQAGLHPARRPAPARLPTACGPLRRAAGPFPGASAWTSPTPKAPRRNAPLTATAPKATTPFYPSPVRLARRSFGRNPPAALFPLPRRPFSGGNRMSPWKPDPWRPAVRARRRGWRSARHRFSCSAFARRRSGRRPRTTATGTRCRTRWRPGSAWPPATRKPQTAVPTGGAFPAIFATSAGRAWREQRSPIFSTHPCSAWKRRSGASSPRPGRTRGSGTITG